MANSKLLLASIAFVLVVVGVRSDFSIEGGATEPEASGSALRLEFDGPRSKISTLESSIEDRIREIKTKEDSIAQLNAVVIQEKLLSIASLESEIESLQKKGAVDAKTLSGKANARVGELEKQIVKLKSEIEAQSKKRNALDSWASEAEKQLQELDLRLESEELMRAQLEATSKFKELNEKWIPAAKEQLSVFKSNAEPYLQKIHTKSFEVYDASKDVIAPHIVKILEVIYPYFQEASEFSKPYIDKAVIVTEPHIEKLCLVLKPYTKHLDRTYRESLRTARTYHRQNWIPAAKEQLSVFKSNAEPYLQKIHTKSFEVYDASKDVIAPHIVKIQEVIYPYFQEASEFSKPYIDKAVIVTKPRIVKFRLVLKPYTKHVARTYRKSLRTARTYHVQKWIPAAKEQLTVFKSNAEPYLQKIHTKSFEVYDASKDVIAPHIVKIQEVIYPYFQEASEFSKPYIDKAVIVTKPRIEKLCLVLKPYTKHVARTYHKSLRTARTYHRQMSCYRIIDDTIAHVDPEVDFLASLTSESGIEDRIREIKTKEDNIAQLNAVVIQEKLLSIASLESEIESLQKKGAADAKTLSGKANARVGELEKQIVKLKSEIESQSKKRNALDSRASEAEKQLQELDLRLESKWIPAAKEQLSVLKSNVEPYLQKIHTKSFEVYDASKDVIAPHIVKIQEVIYPYFQEASEFSKPYIDKAVIVTKPRIEKLPLVLKPYTKHVARTYRKSLRTARTYHLQVQVNIHVKLKKHKLTKPHATKELAWFLASALLAFPIFFLYRFLAAAFCKKARKPRRNTHSSRTPQSQACGQVE